MQPALDHLLTRYRDGADVLRAAFADITDEELDRAPADAGWTARQVAHHVAESEATAFVRLRRLIAEDAPVISSYDEALFAERNHYERPIAPALAVVDAVRTSSLDLLRALSPAEWLHAGSHSESGRYSVEDWLRIYADHPWEHAAQVRLARGWDRFVAVAGGALWTMREGSGPPVLLLHAGIADSRAWDPLVPLLTTRGMSVIRYDRRGFGRTSTEDVEFSNRADAVAILEIQEQGAAAFVDALGIDQAIVVGNSQGGQIAVDLAIEHPERVAGLMTLGASVGGLEVPVSPADEAMFERMDALEETGDAAAVVDLDIAVWVDGPAGPADRAPRHIRDAVRVMDLAIQEPRERGRAIPSEPRAATRLDAIAAPVIAVAGELDVSDVWPTAQALATGVRDGRSVLLPDVAHMVAMEAPEPVAALIVDLVRRR